MTRKYDLQEEKKVPFSVLITVYAKNRIFSYSQKHGISESAVLERMVDLLVEEELRENHD